MNSKVYLASDHGGFEYKEELKVFLKDRGYEVEDMGNIKLDPEDDYPDFVIPLAEKVLKEPYLLLRNPYLLGIPSAPLYTGNPRGLRRYKF